MTVSTSLLLLSTLFACVADVGEGKVAAEVAEAPAPSAEKAAPAAAGKALKIDTSASKVHALGAKITATHPVDFKKWEGTVTVDGDAVTDLNFTIHTASLESDHPKLTGHLKNEDFLFVEKFPTASFDASEIKAGSDKEGATHTVTGALEIRGVTKQVTFPAKIEVAERGVKAATEFVINRRDFEVIYDGKADDLVQDNVVLTVEIAAPR